MPIPCAKTHSSAEKVNFERHPCSEDFRKVYEESGEGVIVWVIWFRMVVINYFAFSEHSGVQKTSPRQIQSENIGINLEA